MTFRKDDAALYLLRKEVVLIGWSPAEIATSAVFLYVSVSKPFADRRVHRVLQCQRNTFEAGPAVLLLPSQRPM